MGSRGPTSPRFGRPHAMGVRGSRIWDDSGETVPRGPASRACAQAFVIPRVSDARALGPRARPDRRRGQPDAATLRRDESPREVQVRPALPPRPRIHGRLRRLPGHTHTPEATLKDTPATPARGVATGSRCRPRDPRPVGDEERAGRGDPRSASPTQARADGPRRSAGRPGRAPSRAGGAGAPPIRPFAGRGRPGPGGGSGSDAVSGDASAAALARVERSDYDEDVRPDEATARPDADVTGVCPSVTPAVVPGHCAPRWTQAVTGRAPATRPMHCPAAPRRAGRRRKRRGDRRARAIAGAR